MMCCEMRSVMAALERGSAHVDPALWSLGPTDISSGSRARPHSQLLIQQTARCRCADDETKSKCDQMLKVTTTFVVAAMREHGFVATDRRLFERACFADGSLARRAAVVEGQTRARRGEASGHLAWTMR